jgi:hypothetical protein
MNSLGRRLLHLIVEAIEFIWLVLFIPFIAVGIALEQLNDYQFPT